MAEHEVNPEVNEDVDVEQPHLTRNYKQQKAQLMMSLLPHKEHGEAKESVH